MLPQHIEIKDALWNNISFKSEGKNFEIFVCRFFLLKTKLRTKILLDRPLNIGPIEFLVALNTTDRKQWCRARSSNVLNLSKRWFPLDWKKNPHTKMINMLPFHSLQVPLNIYSVTFDKGENRQYKLMAFLTTTT